MRNCYRCWKNLKLNPAYTLHNKKTSESYLICDKCKDSNIVTELLQSEHWDLTHNTPTLQEIKKGD